MTSQTFRDLGLADPLQRALAALDYTTPTPIQRDAIPLLLDGNDLLGIAQTGSGKTAAFCLPILDHLSARPRRPRPCAPRALILCPTRELAAQILDSLIGYGRNVRLHHAMICGGVNQTPQVRALRRGVDVLIATPGRLEDLMQQRHVDLRDVTHLVLDEADRMLDMGFIPAVRRITTRIPTDRQTMLFSATMPKEVVALTRELLRSPVRVEVATDERTQPKIEEAVYFVPKQQKRFLLAEVLSNPEMTRTIVFTRTKHGADRVVRHLRTTELTAEAIHGDKAQGARKRALEAFRRGDSQVLVATDIAARGLDIDDISHVVNFDLPNVPETYVHRIGRTARAGSTGIAISFCDATERTYLADIEKLTGRRIRVVSGDAPPPPPTKAAPKRANAPQGKSRPKFAPRAKPRRRRKSFAAASN